MKEINRIPWMFVLILLVLLTGLFPLAGAQSSDNGDEDRGPNTSVLLPLITSVGLVLVGLVFYRLVRNWSDERTINQGRWRKLCILVCTIMPIVVVWIAWIVNIHDLFSLGGRSLWERIPGFCGIISMFVFITYVCFMIPFFHFLHLSTMKINDFPDQFRLKVDEGYRIYVAAIMFTVGITLILYSLYPVYSEWGYWSDMLYALSGTEFLVGMIFIGIGIFLYKMFIIPVEILIDSRVIRKKHGKSLTEVPWEYVRTITFRNVQTKTTIYHDSARPMMMWRSFLIEHSEGTLDFTGTELGSEKRLLLLFFALLYNRERSNLAVEIELEPTWGQAWYDEMMPQVKKLAGNDEESVEFTPE